MAFISSGTTVLSFAEYSDVQNRDARLFESNEGLTEASTEDLLIRSSERIITLLNNALGITVDINLILARQNDFTDLCVYHTLSEYLLPKYADIGNEEDSEFNKITYYSAKFNSLFIELVGSGDWYDSNDDGTVSTSESVATVIPMRRVR